MTERPYLSIGEVLGLLLEEFSDVTISKIRFLESQGLIEPERTASGYRKFYDADVERLKVILREQRQNFLPLRVIRDRLESGAIESDASGPIVLDETTDGATGETADGSVGSEAIETSAASVSGEAVPEASSASETSGTASPVPRGIRNVVTAASPATDGAEVSTSRHPAAPRRPTPSTNDRTANGAAAIAPPTGAVLARRDLCTQAGITDDELAQLESYGVVSGKGGPGRRQTGGQASGQTGSQASGQGRYSASDVVIARAAGGFLRHGIDARHLRAWRTSAEREAGLFEQRILPLLRQRNPRARQEAGETLGELAELGAALRAALVAEALRPHLDS